MLSLNAVMLQDVSSDAITVRNFENGNSAL